jgi:hypothetical protein
MDSRYIYVAGILHKDEAKDILEVTEVRIYITDLMNRINHGRISEGRI